MRIAIDVALQYRLTDDPMVLLSIEAARTDSQTVECETLDITDATIERLAADGEVGQRIWARVAHDTLNLRYTAQVDVNRPAHSLKTLKADAMHTLPADALRYLRPSRYIQSDMFTGFVEQHFGDLHGGEKIVAITEWVAEEMTYAPTASNADTTVLETFATRQGVCRDYTHMVCALSRAANIPARYVAVYGPDVSPSDFHAVAEVWLGGNWHLVDATGMCSPTSSVIIAAGRDACDVPFMETENFAHFENQTVKVTMQGVNG